MRFDLNQQGLQIDGRAQINAVGPKVDTRQDNLVVPHGSHMVEMTEDLSGTHAAASSTGVGYDTVSTETVASVLDFEKGAGACSRGRHQWFGKWDSGIEVLHRTKWIGIGMGCRLDDEFGQIRFATVAHNGMHAIDYFNLFGGDLGVTSGDNDAGARMASLQLPNYLARLHGSFLGDGARVYDTDIGDRAIFNSLPAMGVQGGRENIGFVLVDFTS